MYMCIYICIYYRAVSRFTPALIYNFLGITRMDASSTNKTNSDYTAFTQVYICMYMYMFVCVHACTDIYVCMYARV